MPLPLCDMTSLMTFKSENMANSHQRQQQLEELHHLRRAQESLDQQQTRLRQRRECQRGLPEATSGHLSPLNNGRGERRTGGIQQWRQRNKKRHYI